MPTYEYLCETCEAGFECYLPMSQCSDPQPCPECGALGKRVLSMPNFVLKGDGWPGKNIKIKGQMEAKNRVLDQKQEERKRNPAVRLSPNVDGERVDSWSDAQKLAASKGKNTESYDAKVREEKAK
jgi:putative FmdB family regulatory protein